jgi:6-pyruvoyl-tetrahydropterin synthase
MTARWVIHSRSAFTARHALTVYRGKPEDSHAHEWEVAIQVGAESLNDEGFALDFHEIHSLLENAVSPLRATDLNQHPKIGSPSPSAERVAVVLADMLRSDIAAIGGRLLMVSVWEGPENRVDLRLE